MKTSTFKTLLLSALVGSSYCVHAQEITFTYDENEFVDNIWNSHRSAPFVADFNNDGNMDFYYGGTSYVNGWQTRGVLMKGLGDRKFACDFETLTETYEEVLTDMQGNDSVVTRERYVGMVTGLPKSAWGLGSLPFDFNNDGLVDFLFLNVGGNDTGTSRSVLLVKNLGDFKFETVADEALGSLALSGDKFNEENEISCISLADYDKDGYTDLVYEDMDANGRFVKLFRNIKGDHFEEAKVFAPLPYDVETNCVGVYVQEPSTLDEEGVEIPGAFTNVPTMAAKPLSHGGVSFGDFDGDGWPDIVASGYANKNEDDPVKGVQEGGDQIRFYRNMQDGTFKDATDELCAEGETVNDVFKRWGNEDGVMSVVDYNQDGLQDIIIVGSMRDRGIKQAIVLLNSSTPGHFAFTEAALPIVAASGYGVRGFLAVDMNGDGFLDFYGRGWTNALENPANSWVESISASAGEGEYNFQIFGVNDYHFGGCTPERSTAMGDLDGDGRIDLVATSWGSPERVSVSWNTTDVAMEAPLAPTDVKAISSENRVTVSWNNGNDFETPYNVYLKSVGTGEVRMLVPANVATGKQSSYAQWAAYCTSNGAEVPSYTFENVPDGKYMVGVQAVSYAYLGSEFATTQVSVTTGIENAESNTFAISARTNQFGIVVNSNLDANVEIYNVAGAKVAVGRTNSAIPVNGNGIYVIKVNDKVLKVLK